MADENPLPYMYLGTVTDRTDPDGLGRVRFKIPGVIEPESEWAWPMGGRGTQNGDWAVPQLDALVAVWFREGDADHPWYQPAHWPDRPTEAEADVPTYLQDVPLEERPDVYINEYNHFQIVVDDRVGDPAEPGDGKQRVLISLKDTEEDFIEIDGLNRAIQIRGTTGILIESTSGLVNIRGLQVQINGRVVNPITTKEI